jgi:hypothetical protein
VRKFSRFGKRRDSILAAGKSQLLFREVFSEQNTPGAFGQ